MAHGENIPQSILFADGLETSVRDSEELSDTVARLADDVRVTVAVTTESGEPIQHQRGTLTKENYRTFAPRPDAQAHAVAKLRDLGLTVIRQGRFGITVSGPADLIRELSGAELVVQSLPRTDGLGAVRNFAASYGRPRSTDLFLAPQSSLTVAPDVDQAIDHFVFTPPPIYFAPSPVPPTVGYHNVAAADIRRILNVPQEFDGSGVRMAVVDTGFYDHPYYRSNNLDYRAVSTPSSPNADVDSHGHGTAITFNVFATAPGAEVLGFRSSNPPQDALEDAADAGAQIITSSWGYPREQVFPILQATLLDLIADGVIILFAAGNGHYAWPGSEPGVLSIGGVYADAQSNLEASNYASGFMSSVFPGRRVPDFCGLCGEQPRAIYIVMPTQPGNQMDRSLGGQSFPDFDDTANDDGWVGASGTSSATPQIAGVVALMLEKAEKTGRTLKADQVRSILERTSKPISRGRNAMGIPATNQQPNTAVGWGLVDAAAALSAV